MGCAAWPHAVDPTTGPATVCPRAAILTENCPGEERIAIFDKVVRCLFLWCYCGNILVGDLAQNLGYERHLCLSCAAICQNILYLQTDNDKLTHQRV